MNPNNEKTNVLIVGASGSLAQYVIAALQPMDNVSLTLFARNKNRISTSSAHGNRIIEGDVLDDEAIKKAMAGQHIVYLNLAGDLERMGTQLVRAMQDADVKRIIAICSIGIYAKPLKPVLIPYRKLADIIENSGLDYTILRPDWFTHADEIDYALTQKGAPETGQAISRKSIAAFVASLIENPELHKKENLGISKP